MTAKQAYGRSHADKGAALHRAGSWIGRRFMPASDTTAMILTELSSSEHDAIFAGIFAGEDALEHSRNSAVLKLFVRRTQTHRAMPRLEALRAYAELRRVLLPQDRVVSTTSLSAAGFTQGQIAKFDAIIVAWPEG